MDESNKILELVDAESTQAGPAAGPRLHDLSSVVRQLLGELDGQDLARQEQNFIVCEVHGLVYRSIKRRKRNDGSARLQANEKSFIWSCRELLEESDGLLGLQQLFGKRGALGGVLLLHVGGDLGLSWSFGVATNKRSGEKKKKPWSHSLASASSCRAPRSACGCW